MRSGADRERVVVVGAGPVGMTAALGLARRGVPVTVLEAEAAPSTETRASTIHPPSLEMLDELGVVEPLLEIGLPAPVLQHRDIEGGVIAEIDASVLADETRYPYRLQCEQHHIGRVISDEIERAGLDVEVRFGDRVVGVRQTAEGVEAVVTRRTAAVGAVDVVAGSYLIGADGAQSTVRDAAGIGFAGVQYPERYLVLTITLDMASVLPGLALVNYVSGPRDWYALIRNDRAWRVLLPTPLDEPPAVAASDETIQRRLAALAPRPGGYPVEQAALYRVHQRLADSFRAGRVLLAGDAAHLNNPLGGLGMNSGIHDAFFLSAVLARVWHGAVGDGAAAAGALDRYAQVRRRVCESFVNRLADANWSGLRETSPGQRCRRAEALRSLASDPCKTKAYLLRALMFEGVRETCTSLAEVI